VAESAFELPIYGFLRTRPRVLTVFVTYRCYRELRQCSVTYLMRVTYYGGAGTFKYCYGPSRKCSVSAGIAWHGSYLDFKWRKACGHRPK